MQGYSFHEVAYTVFISLTRFLLSAQMSVSAMHSRHRHAATALALFALAGGK